VFVDLKEPKNLIVLPRGTFSEVFENNNVDPFLWNSLVETFELLPKLTYLFVGKKLRLPAPERHVFPLQAPFRFIPGSLEVFDVLVAGNELLLVQ